MANNSATRWGLFLEAVLILHGNWLSLYKTKDKMPNYKIWYWKKFSLCLSSKWTFVKHFIFRILRLSSTRVLEVYPGDGSVIVSQGVKGLYYKHIIPYGDRVWNGQLDFMCRIWISCEDFLSYVEYCCFYLKILLAQVSHVMNYVNTSTQENYTGKCKKKL